MKMHWIAMLVLSVVAASAQTATERAYSGQSWVGLLVSASCDKKTGAQSKSNREADLTVERRTTTPAVDSAGTRGAAAVDGSTPSGEKQSMPETGDILANSKSATDPGWSAARKQARGLGAACVLRPNASHFALLLPDGRMLLFDELADETIVKQMPANAVNGKAPKYLRVTVQGKLQNGKIALDSIQM